MSAFYALRYASEVPLEQRKHAQTLGRFESWVEADEERERRAHARLLEVVVRGDS